MPSRSYRKFTWKDANFQISCRHSSMTVAAIRQHRAELEAYICRQPQFAYSLQPLALLSDAPEAARRMSAAAAQTGVGPMAAVAGTMAQLAAEAAQRFGDRDIVIENGGDIFAIIDMPLVLGLYAGASVLSGTLALHIEPAQTPLAVCSSSSSMGHSLSFGNCDLATVTAADAALADAAATWAANQVHCRADIQPTLDKLSRLAGISGAIIIKDDAVGLVGNLPKLIRHHDAGLKDKISRDRRSMPL